jgi:uncharacterized membrane protein
MRLAETQGVRSAVQPAVFAETGTVDIGRWLTAGWTMVSADLGTWMLATLLMLVLTFATCGLGGPAMLCGLYLLAFRKQAGRPVVATDVTLGFRRFLNAFLAYLLLMLPSLILTGVQQVLQMMLQVMVSTSGGGREPNFGLVGLLMVVSLGGSLVNMVVGYATYTVGFFTLPLVAARNIGPVEAISQSWAVVRRNPWMFLLTTILFQLIMPLGFVALCVGVLVTVPLVVASTAQAYTDHFGLDDAALD